MSYYAMPNSTGIVEFLVWANATTSYLMGPLLVLAWVMIVFMALKNYPTEKAFSSATFSGMILCMGFYAIGICEVQHVILCGVAVLVSVFMLKQDQF